MNWDISTLPVYVARALKDHHDRDVALSIASDGTILDIGIDETDVAGVSASYPQSAIINLLQSATADVDRIAVTVAPDERDLGMARIFGVTRIMFMTDSDPRTHRRTRKQGLGNAWSDAALHQPVAGPLDTMTGLSAPDLTPSPPAASTEALDWFYDSFEEFRFDFAAAGRAQVAQKLGGTTRFNPPMTRKGAVRPILESSGLAELRKWVGAAERLRDSALARLDDTTARQDRARRGRFVPPPDRFTLPPTLQPTTHREDPWVDQLFMRLAFAIVGQLHGSRDRLGLPGGHGIGSVLRGPNDEIIGWAINTNKDGRLGYGRRALHGEVNCLQNHFRQPGVGSLGDAGHQMTLYTTLEPCFMCAGMYKQSGPNLRCYYGQVDRIVRNRNALGEGGQTFMRTPTSRALERAMSGLPDDASLAGQFDNHMGIWRAAVFRYFSLMLNYSGELDRWFDQDNDHLRVVWENGLRLLCHADPLTATLWQHALRVREFEYPVTGVSAVPNRTVEQP